MMWFRWYAGSCEDGKFRMVARNADVTVATVMGVWACLLEDASHAEHRGICTRGEDFYCAILDLDDADFQRILESMQDIGLISVGHGSITVINWGKRQFESDAKDPTNADRQRRFRDKHKTNDDQTLRNGSVTVSKLSDTDSEADTEKKDSGAQAAPKKRSTKIDVGTCQPTPENISYAVERGLNAERVALDIRGWAANAPPAKRMKLDFGQFWEGWCRREADKLRPGGGNSAAPKRHTTQMSNL